MHTLEMPPGKQLNFLSLFKSRIIYLLTCVTSMHKIGLIIILSSAALSYLVHAWVRVVYLFSLSYIAAAAPFSLPRFAPPKNSMILGYPSNTQIQCTHFSCWVKVYLVTILQFIYFLGNKVWNIFRVFFFFFAILNSIAKNIHAYISWYTCKRVSLGYMPRRGIADWWGKQMFIFKRKCHITF